MQRALLCSKSLWIYRHYGHSKCFSQTTASPTAAELAISRLQRSVYSIELRWQQICDLLLYWTSFQIIFPLMSRLIVALSRAKARIKSASFYFGFRYELQRAVVQDLSLFLLHLTLLLLKSYLTKYRRKNCESIRFVLFCLKQFLFEIFKKSQKLPLVQNLTQKCF